MRSMTTLCHSSEYAVAIVMSMTSKCGLPACKRGCTVRSVYISTDLQFGAWMIEVMIRR